MRNTDLINRIEELARGGKTRGEIAAVTGYSRGYISDLLKENGIEAIDGRKMKQTQRRPEIDVLLTGEYALNKIGRMLESPTSRQSVTFYLERTGQYDAFMEKRRKYRAFSELKPKRQELLQLFREHAIKDAGDWTTEKALRYYFAGHPQSVSADKLVRLFRIYENALKGGKKLSFQQLAGRSRMAPSTVHKIFSKTGLGSMHWKQTHVKDKKNAILGIYRTGRMGVADIAYFIGPGVHSVYKTVYRNLPDRPVRGYRLIKDFGDERLTYRDASQAYEARDWGWPSKDITLCLEKPKSVAYALTHRREIEPVIIWALDKLHPNVRHDKPYL